MQNIELNTWYQTEKVTPEDMLKINQTFIQAMFAGNGGKPQIIGGGITVNGNNFIIAKGFVYFGESTDATYIARTGTNQLCAVILPASYPLVNVNCYIYVTYTITYSPSNRTATVSANVYSSVNPTDDGIKICDIVNNVPTNYTNHNITDYFAIGSNNTLVLTDPSGNSYSLAVNNVEATGNIESIGDISSQGTGNFGSNNNGGTNSFTTKSSVYTGAIAKTGTNEDGGIIKAQHILTSGYFSGSSGVDYDITNGTINAQNISRGIDGSVAIGGKAYYTTLTAGNIVPSVGNEIRTKGNYHGYCNIFADVLGTPVLLIGGTDPNGVQGGLQIGYDVGNSKWKRPSLVIGTSDPSIDFQSVYVFGDNLIRFYRGVAVNSTVDINISCYRTTHEQSTYVADISGDVTFTNNATDGAFLDLVDTFHAQLFDIGLSDQIVVGWAIRHNNPNVWRIILDRSDPNFEHRISLSDTLDNAIPVNAGDSFRFGAKVILEAIQIF